MVRRGSQQLHVPKEPSNSREEPNNTQQYHQQRRDEFQDVASGAGQTMSKISCDVYFEAQLGRCSPPPGLMHDALTPRAFWGT